MAESGDTSTELLCCQLCKRLVKTEDRHEFKIEVARYPDGVGASYSQLLSICGSCENELIRATMKMVAEELGRA